MTSFSQLKQADGTLVDFEPKAAPPAKRPSRWSLSNWPVRWKVFAIVLVPLVLAGTFGGLRIYASVTDASDLRRAADRAEMVPPIVNYMAALESAMVAGTEGGDTQAALTEFDSSKAELSRQLADTDVESDVRLATNTLLDYGQDLVNKVMSNSIDLRTRVTTYAPLLLTSETAITGSVRSDEQSVQTRGRSLVARRWRPRPDGDAADAWSIAVVDLPEPELRTSMITLAGTEPSTVSGMSKLLGRRIGRGGKHCAPRWSSGWG